MDIKTMTDEEKSEIISLCRGRIAFATEKRKAPGTRPAAWGETEWDAYWDGQEKCASWLMNQVHKLFSSSP